MDTSIINHCTKFHQHLLTQETARW